MNIQRLRKKVKFNKGFSLIEVLLAIVILGLVAAPILQIFITSARINQNSRELMAATEVATMTMEHITSMKMDGGDGSARKYFTESGDLTRIPGVGYNATVVDFGVSYSDYNSFKAAAVDTNNKVVYCAGTSDGGNLGLMMTQVVYNNFKFDVLVWCEPSATVDKFFTYDVTVEVYAIDSVEVENSDGSTYTDYIHFDECLVTMDGAVPNQ